jgi:segregation and condensation protein B
MNEQYLRNVIEAALLAAGRPVQPAELVQLFDESARPTSEQLRTALDALAAEYGARGIELKETAGGVRIQVRRELAGEVSRLWPERPARYSRALLETLALIAYRQPITRGEIEAVRGVAVNPNIVKTLLERNWVRVVGHRDVPGRPELLGTTRDFLDYFGLKSLDELPALSELKAVGDFNLQLDLSADAGEGSRAGGGAGEAAVAAAADVGGGSQPAAEGSAPAGDESGARAAGAGELPSDETLLEGSAENAGEDDDERDDGDELSAEGGDSRELVAAPRDNGD